MGPPLADVANRGPPVNISLCLIVGSSVIFLYLASFNVLYHSLAHGSHICLPSQGGTHEKYVSMEKCFHKNRPAACVTAHT
jgi:hypothetical protein